MWILRLVRNFALLAVLALAAHAAAGADGPKRHCGGSCGFFKSCPTNCSCSGLFSGHCELRAM